MLLSWTEATAVSSLLFAAIFYKTTTSKKEPAVVEQSSTKKARISDETEENKKKEEDDHSIIVPGIWNIGNTCFLNALMQAIAASQSLVKHLRNVDELLEAEAIYSGTSSSYLSFARLLCNAVNDLQATHPLTKNKITSQEGVLSSLVHYYFKNPSSENQSLIVLDFSSLERKLRTVHSSFSTANEQQDADELFTLVIDMLEKESKSAWRVLAPSLKTIGLTTILEDELENQNNTSKQGNWWGTTSSSTNTTNSSHPRVPLRNPLEGTLLSLIQCETCGRKSPLRSQPFYILSLPIPSMMIDCTLEDCLKEFTKFETVQDVECSRCACISGRNPKQRARKRLMIGRLPIVVCIRLQRNQFDIQTGRIFKDDKKDEDSRISTPTTSIVSSSPWRNDEKELNDTSTNIMLKALSGQIIITPPQIPMILSSPSLSPKNNNYNSNTSTPTKRIVSYRSDETKFQLVAIIEHIGNAFGGHFVAYRFVEFENQSFWVRCSDDNVMVVPESFVFNNVQCYMCIYESLRK